MILKNDALQELYDTLMFGPVLSSPYAESPIDRAFKECDEKLSESIAFDYLKKLQDRIEVLERSNKDLRDNNDKLGDKIIELKKDLDAKTKENSALVSANADLSDRNAHLQRNYERIDQVWTRSVLDNMALRSENASLKREKEEAEKELDDAKRNRDGWKSRTMHTEKRYAELRKENADLSEKVVDFEKRIAELQKKGDDLTKKGEDLQQEIEELKKSRKHLRRLYVGEGTRKLWDMLQNVNDSQPNEFDVECESMEDVISMDLDDFLDCYKKWQKEKEKNETDRMRGWLANFCEGRVCEACPLESSEYKCGCGYSFKKADESDTRIIPDEDIKRYYEKARGCGRYTLKDATFYFDNKPVTMGGTIEATVEINKDVLNTVLGVKSKEEEHKLDYGDAVRLPWRDYDYMYIGPEGKHIRLFDPKTHTVVVVSVTDNLTYQGCKIILCDEDDIRKIWKDKK